MQTRTTMRAAMEGRHYTMLILALALAACGPGNVAPGDDDASGDDDAVAGDDDLAGDDDAATGGTGTINVTVEVLAVLSEGQTVEAEIVVALAPFSDFIEEVEINGTTVPFSDASEGYATGRTPPADIVVTAGQRYVVALKANEPNAPVEQRFVAAPHEVVVERDGTAECGMFLGRDLTGRWRNVEEGGSTVLNHEPFDVQMSFGPMGRRDDPVEPCLSLVWGGGFSPMGDMCLQFNDRVGLENTTAPYLVEGEISDDGRRVVYTITLWFDEGGPPRGPWAYERED